MNDCATCALVGIRDCDEHGFAESDEHERMRLLGYALMDRRDALREEAEATADAVVVARLQEVEEVYQLWAMAYMSIPAVARRMKARIKALARTQVPA